MANVIADGSRVRAYQLLRQRDLLQRHLVHAGRGRASRHGGGEDRGSLHDCSDVYVMVMDGEDEGVCRRRRWSSRAGAWQRNRAAPATACRER